MAITRKNNTAVKNTTFLIFLGSRLKYFFSLCEDINSKTISKFTKQKPNQRITSKNDNKEMCSTSKIKTLKY